MLWTGPATVLMMLDSSDSGQLAYSTDAGKTFSTDLGIPGSVADVVLGGNKSWAYVVLSNAKQASEFPPNLYLSETGGQSFFGCTVQDAQGQALEIVDVITHPTRGYRALVLVGQEAASSDDDRDGTTSAPLTFDVYAIDLTTATGLPTTCAVTATLVESDVLSVDYFRPSPEMPTCRASTVYLTRQTLTSSSALEFVRVNYPYGESHKEVLLQDAFHYEQVHQYIFVFQFLDPAANQDLALWVSTDMGDNFNRALFPFEGSENLYSFVDATEDISLISLQQTVTQYRGIASVVVLKNGQNVSLQAVSSDFTPMPQNFPGTTMAFVSSGCHASDFNSFPQNTIAVAVRGSCHFYDKVLLAESFGAAGMIIINTDDELQLMGAPAEVEQSAYPHIPALLVNRTAGQLLRNLPITTQVILDDEGVAERDLFQESVLYVSGPDATHYTAALKDVVDAGSFGNTIVDVYKVQGSNSTYIANYLNFSLAPPQMTSVITFNKGAYWQPLTVSTYVDENGLTLALYTSRAEYSIPLPLTHPQAPNIIIANGRVGGGDIPDLTSTGVYMSIDGGHGWFYVLDGVHDFAFVDHGGIILAAPLGVKTSQLWYATTPSNSPCAFRSLPLPASLGSVFIEGIFANPAGELSAWLYIRSPSATGAVSLTGVFIDFSGLFPTPCQPSQMEPFYPYSAHERPQDLSQNCIDGQHVTFSIRRGDAMCYLGPSFVSMVSHVPCTCTFLDYECTPGYVRENPFDNSSLCGHDPYYVPVISCPPGQAQIDIVHYRQIAGDTCTATDDQLTAALLTPAVLPCPNYSPSSRSTPSSSKGLSAGATAAVVLVVILVLGGGVFALLLWKSPGLRHKVAACAGADAQGSCLGRCLARASVRTTDYRYSALTQEENRGKAVPDDDDEDDEMLFGVGDAQVMHKA